MSRPLIQQLFHNINDIPPYPADGDTSKVPFWSTLDSDDFKLAVNFLMVHKSRQLAQVGSENMHPEAKASYLGYFQALGELLNLRDSLKDASIKEPEVKDPLTEN